MIKHARRVARRMVLSFNRITFHLWFTRVPQPGRYCNSKLISVLSGAPPPRPKKFLVFIRSGGGCRLIDGGGGRNFDIAINLYAAPKTDLPKQYEYLVVGGLNKYKAAYQFLDSRLLNLYEGFMFLDDDLDMTYAELGGFLEFCRENDLPLAQPSQSPDSHCSHEHLLRHEGARCRHVEMVEVMCPYFSTAALKIALRTFDFSYSTWGLDYLWPMLPGLYPVVVDKFAIRHTRPMQSGGAFYRYMSSIGVEPKDEEFKLRAKFASKRSADRPVMTSKVCVETNTRAGNTYER